MKAFPNILLILADDVGTNDVPGYWAKPFVDMPNLVKLQSQGVTFLDAHSTPLCAPTRYMLLSGNYPHRGVRYGGSWNFFYQQNNFVGNQKSLAHVLKTQAGYHTAMFGKWHLGAGVPPPGTYRNESHVLTESGSDWTNPIVDGPQEVGFDSSYMTISGIQSPPYSFFRDGILDHDLSDLAFWEAGDYVTGKGDISKIKDRGEGSVDWDSTSYNMILVNETVSFLDRHVQTRAEDPFFIYAALGQVHIPHSPPKYYLDGSPVAGQYENDHLDLLLEMDKVVGSLISAVEDRGMGNDTIFIFASDNGGLRVNDSNRYLRASKGTVYEGGHRVPLVMRYDGVFPTGEKRQNHFVGLNDIYATLADIVGITIPSLSAVDSVSFAHYIQSENNTTGLRDSLGSWRYREGTVESEAIRYKNMKLVRNYLLDTDELFDFDKEIQEKKNLIGDPQYRDVLKQMYKELRRIGPCPFDASADDMIWLENGGRKDKLVTCDWFRANSNRCRWQYAGELMCNSICGRHTGLCRNYPPVQQSIHLRYCVDNQDFTFVLDNGSERECSWMEQNPVKAAVRKESVCQNETIAMNCQRTCGACVELDTLNAINTEDTAGTYYSYSHTMLPGNAPSPSSKEEYMDDDYEEEEERKEFQVASDGLSEAI